MKTPHPRSSVVLRIAQIGNAWHGYDRKEIAYADFFPSTQNKLVFEHRFILTSTLCSPGERFVTDDHLAWCPAPWQSSLFSHSLWHLSQSNTHLASNVLARCSHSGQPQHSDNGANNGWTKRARNPAIGENTIETTLSLWVRFPNSIFISCFAAF